MFITGHHLCVIVQPFVTESGDKLGNDNKLV
jgi:hypothetical protein